MSPWIAKGIEVRPLAREFGLERTGVADISAGGFVKIIDHVLKQAIVLSEIGPLGRVDLKIVGSIKFLDWARALEFNVVVASARPNGRAVGGAPRIAKSWELRRPE